MSVHFSRAILPALLACAALAQDAALDPRTSIKVDFPGDSPLTLVSADMGQSRATARGGAMVLDLHIALQVRNSSGRRVRGVTLLATAQEVMPGGRGSVSVPCLDIAVGETFPIRLDLRLLRPLQQGSGPLVRVDLDGVLFEDFNFYGANRLDSRRTLTVWETQAQRERQYLKALLDRQGTQALQRAMLESIDRISSRPQLDVQVARARNGAVSSAASSAMGDSERQVQFAFLNLPDSPVEPLRGSAMVAGNEARTPRISVRNRSSKAVRHYEIGWLVADPRGNQYWAASVPGSPSNALLAPGSQSQALQETTLKFLREGKPVPVQSMTAFVSQVEFADGHIWVPARSDMQTNQLLRLMAPTPEEQRLADIYRKKGIAGITEELRRF